MHLLSHFTGILLLVSQIQGIEYYTLDQVTVPWLIDNKCDAPTPSQCLFYTTGMGELARQFARQHVEGITTTIWSHWPEHFYNSWDPEKPFYNIMEGLRLWPRKTKDRRRPEAEMKEIARRYRESQTWRYFARMSEALARMCEGTAYVLTRDENDIPRDGIWNTIELPALEREPSPQPHPDEGQVDLIYIIRTDGTRVQSPIFDRNNGIHPRHSNLTLFSRDVMKAPEPHERCECQPWSQFAESWYADHDIWNNLVS